MTRVYHAAYVLDASVAVKWFTKDQERDQDKALLLRQRFIAGACGFIVPALLLVEVLSALRRQPRFQEPDVAAALEALERLHLEIRELGWDALRKTNAISWAYGISPYDAAYVALAEAVGYPLITADEALASRMTGHSIILRLRDLEFPDS